MENEGIKLSVEKNVYKSGLLNFRIYNPESEEYGEVNAFADENPLLRFASESRELSDCAEDLIITLTSVYERMKKVTVEFKGTKADYDTLVAASKKVKSTVDLIVSPDFEMDPENIISTLNSYIDEFNEIIGRKQFVEAISECKKDFDISLDYQKIEKMETGDNPKELLSAMQQKLDYVKSSIKKLKGAYESLCLESVSVSEISKAHVKEMSILKQKDLIWALVQMSAEKNEPSKKNIDRLLDCIISNGDLSDIFEDNSLEDLLDNTIVETFVSVQKIIKHSYQSKTYVLGSTICDYTKGIASDFAEVLMPHLIENIDKFYNDQWEKSSKLVAMVYSELLGCPKSKISIPKLKSMKTMDIQRVVSSSDVNLSYRIKNHYDNGEYFLPGWTLKTYSRQPGVTRKEGRKGEADKYSLDIDKYLSSFCTDTFYWETNQIVEKIKNMFLNNFIRTVLNMVPEFLKEDETVKNSDAKTKKIDDLQAELLNAINEIEKPKNNIIGIIKKAREEGGDT